MLDRGRWEKVDELLDAALDRPAQLPSTKASKKSVSTRKQARSLGPRSPSLEI